LPAVSKCRSTLLVSSIRAIRERGHFDAYDARLDPAFRDVVIPCIAGVWLPVEAAMAHYRAIDAVGLTAREQAALAEAVTERIGASVFSTVATLAKTSGVTPWTGLRHFQRFFERFFVGGGCSVIKVGPKDARIEVVGLPLAEIPYFVLGYRSLIETIGALFCNRLYVTTISSLVTSTTLGFRAAWA
jgi:hypothetical protein